MTINNSTYLTAVTTKYFAANAVLSNSAPEEVHSDVKEAISDNACAGNVADGAVDAISTMDVTSTAFQAVAQKCKSHLREGASLRQVLSNLAVWHSGCQAAFFLLVSGLK